MGLLNRIAQISTEYLVIIAFAMAVIIPGAVIVYNYSQSSNDKLVGEQVNSIGKELLYTSEQVYHMGKYSRLSVKANIPDSISEIYILDNHELVILYYSQNGIRESVFFSSINITTPGCEEEQCNLTIFPGPNNFRVESRGSFVLLNQTTG
ncbi:MAG: hypothetical protein V1659_01425 [Candidatus Woesearchaeota archaeon]